MGLSRSIFRHTAIYSAAMVIGKLSGFLMLPFYAHIFQTEGYGVIAMIETSLGILTVLLAGGLQTAILRIYHEQPPERKALALGTGMRLVWGLAVGLALLPFIFSVPLSRLILGSPEYYSLICLALTTFVIDVAGQSASTFLVIKERSVLYSFIGLVRMFLGIGLNIWLVLILKVGLVGVFISSLITAAVASLVFHIVAIRDHGFGFDREISAQLLRFQLPMLPGDIVSFLGRQAERILVRIQIGLQGVGILEMAYKFPPLLNLFISIPFQRAWRTKSFEIAEQPAAPVVMGMMLTRYFYLLVFAGLILAVTIPQILELMTPPEFWPAVRITRVEVVTTILSSCNTFMLFGIFYSKHTRLISRMVIILTPLKIALAYVLISTWGLTGAAYSAAIIAAITLMWSSIRSQQYYPIAIEYRNLFLIVISAVMLFYVLEGNRYADFAPAVYLRTQLMPGLVDALQTTWMGSWKSGKLIELLREREEPFVIMLFNLLSCMTYAALIPLVWKPEPEQGEASA
ncbi:MAG: lipopolysaccharide biosynthesis protein [Pseudomonadota bacterium]